MKVGIIGASGYTGGELLRILLSHPKVEIECATSRRFAGEKISLVHKHLTNLTDLTFENPEPKEVAERCDFVFVAVPHGTAMHIVPELLDGGTRVVDLSADYRLPKEVFEKIYGIEHVSPRDAVFGLCELHPEVKDAELCANPGCYPTGAVLAVAPLVSEGLVERVIFDSKSGITGAGAEPSSATHYPNVSDNVSAYKLTTHRHTAEIRQELKRLDQSNAVEAYFTPHVVPAIRGILTTSHVFLKDEVDRETVRSLYREFYEGKYFIRILDTIPTLYGVRGSNFCDIGFEVEEGSKRIVVISAIDNLMKGASGQAVQNMNIMCGFDEREGIWMSPTAP